jgi:hypothetical protein
MKITKMLMTVVAAALVLAASSARAEQILIKAAVKATIYDVSGGRILKIPVTNATIIKDCTSTPGAQLVGVFDTTAKGLVGLAVVDLCGNVQCQIATVSVDEGGSCVDTGVSGTSEEIVCPVSIAFNGGGGAKVVADLKLKLDSQGAVMGGSLKCTGVVEDDNGHPGTISLTAAAAFKPAGNCPQ